MKAFNSLGALLVTGAGGGGGGGTFSGGFSTMGNTAGDTGVKTDRMVLVGSNNITLSGSTNAGSITISIVGAAGGGGMAISAAGNSVSAGTVVFSNSNNVSFGMAGSTVTGTATFAQTNQQMTLFATGNTTQSSTGTMNASSIIMRGSNIVSVGVSNGSLIFDATTPSQTNQQMTLFATGNTTQSSTGTTNASSIIFRGDGLISVGITGGSIEISGTQSNQAFSAAGGSSAFQTLSFSDNPQASFTNNAGQLGITNVRLSLSATGNTTQSSTGTINASSIIVRGSNQVSVGISNGSIIVDATTAAQTNQTGGIYITAQSTGQSSSSTYDLRTLSIVPDGIVSAGWSGGSFRISATQSNQAFSAAGGSSAFQTLNFADTNSVSFTNTNGSVGIASVKLQMFAVSNTTQSSSGTANHTALSFGGAGIASVGVTGGSVVISVPSGGGAGDGGVFAGVSTFGNTAGSTGTVSTGNFVFVGSNNITLSQSTEAAGSAATMTILGPDLFSGGMSTEGNTAGGSGMQSERLVFVGSQNITLSQSTAAGGSGTLSILGWPHISSYENIPALLNESAPISINSVSLAAAFAVPWPLSVSFLRFPVMMTMSSTTIATMASATASASGAISSTWNFVIYSLGTGASSKSLISVTSGSNTWIMSQKISVTNSTQYSISLGYSAQVEGVGTTRTTQYSISNTNYSFTTNQLTEFSSARLIDMPLAASFTPGAYWLILGVSTNSASGGAAGLAALTNCGPFFSRIFCQSATNVSFGKMGATNTAAGGLLGVGSFANAGTTSILDISAISSNSSQRRLYFQLLRSA